MQTAKQEEQELRDLYQILNEINGEVEVFNGQNIHLLPVFSWLVPVLNAKKANQRAKEDIEPSPGEHPYPNLKGFAASDTHSRLEQVHTSGIYLPEDTISLEALTYYLQTKDFERHEQDISRTSFLLGHFLPSFQLK